jgi:hypothetical protein
MFPSTNQMVGENFAWVSCTADKGRWRGFVAKEKKGCMQQGASRGRGFVAKEKKGCIRNRPAPGCVREGFGIPSTC